MDKYEEGWERIKMINEEALKSKIKECEGKHVQQVVYSTYHNAFTQVCFDCKKVRTTLDNQ